MDKLAFLNTYNRGVEIINNNWDQIEEIPQSWRNILQTPGFYEKKVEVLNLWRKHAHPILSNTIMYLEENLENIELIRYSEKYSLLYSIRMPNGNMIYYEGGNPKNIEIPVELQKFWNVFPIEIRNFYENFHNGFFDYTSRSMGIVPVEDILILGKEDWGILEELKEPLKINLNSSFGIFSSGIGGYVVIDTRNCADNIAMLWYTNRRPRYDIKFWDVVDEWIVIGFQT